MFYVDELLFIVRCVVIDAVIVSSSNSIDRQPPAVFWILDLPIVCLPGWFGFILPMIDVIQYISLKSSHSRLTHSASFCCCFHPSDTMSLFFDIQDTAKTILLSHLLPVQREAHISTLVLCGYNAILNFQFERPKLK